MEFKGLYDGEAILFYVYFSITTCVYTPSYFLVMMIERLVSVGGAGGWRGGPVGGGSPIKVAYCVAALIIKVAYSEAVIVPHRPPIFKNQRVSVMRPALCAITFMGQSIRRLAW